ncbi:MAG TPA: hypothetical protein QGF05_04830 [Dehalococcoidia bacterium]|nr:hypothetical protein [Dehalococcoidia bacterium]
MFGQVRANRGEVGRLLALFLAGAGAVIIVAATFSWPAANTRESSDSFDLGFIQGRAQSLEGADPLVDREAAASHSRGLTGGANRGARTDVEAVRLLALHAVLTATAVAGGTYEDGYALGLENGRAQQPRSLPSPEP